MSDQPDVTPAPRPRFKPGERRLQILQAVASMLEQPGGERVTTAALAAKLDLSEAALYRHFASKAQMFEGLIGFIEDSCFGLVNQLAETAQLDAHPTLQARRIVAVLLQFAEKNPGMARVMVGEALILEHERLTVRMNQFFDRIESSLRQVLRVAAEQAGVATPTVQAQVQANVMVSFTLGRLQRFVRSGFKRLPTEQLDAALRELG